MWIVRINNCDRSDQLHRSPITNHRSDRSLWRASPFWNVLPWLVDESSSIQVCTQSCSQNSHVLLFLHLCTVHRSGACYRWHVSIVFHSFTLVLVTVLQRWNHADVGWTRFGRSNPHDHRCQWRHTSIRPGEASSLSSSSSSSLSSCVLHNAQNDRHKAKHKAKTSCGQTIMINNNYF